MFALTVALVILTVAAIAALIKYVPLMILETRQQAVLDGLNGSRPVKGRHVRRSGRHARATRLLAQHRG